MKYKVRLNIILDDTELVAASKIFSDLEEDLIKYGRKINTGLAQEEVSTLELEECHHDSTPPKPCKVLKRATA